VRGDNSEGSGQEREGMSKLLKVRKESNKRESEEVGRPIQKEFQNGKIPKYRVSINDCRVQPAMETCQILNVPLCSANNKCHIFRLGCWLLTRDKFQLCFTPVNINVFII
jgi:hypothetical protein